MSFTWLVKDRQRISLLHSKELYQEKRLILWRVFNGKFYYMRFVYLWMTPFYICSSFLLCGSGILACVVAMAISCRIRSAAQNKTRRERSPQLSLDLTLISFSQPCSLSSACLVLNQKNDNILSRNCPEEDLTTSIKQTCVCVNWREREKGSRSIKSPFPSNATVYHFAWSFSKSNLCFLSGAQKTSSLSCSWLAQQGYKVAKQWTFNLRQSRKEKIMTLLLLLFCWFVNLSVLEMHSSRCWWSTGKGNLRGI